MSVQYRVKKGCSGFFDGVFRTEFKHEIIEAEKPLSRVPSWLELVKPESTAEAKKRLEQEKKESKEKSKKAAEDQKDIANTTGNVNFMEGKAAKSGRSSNVETLG